MAKQKTAVKRRKRKLIVFIIEIIIALVLIAAIYVYHKLDLIDNTKLDRQKVATNEMNEVQQKIYRGYTTIALFGLDNRSKGKLSNGNSDVIMIMNINNDTREVSLTSVYRDTYLNTAGADEDPAFRKANSAYAYGGAEQAITMLNRNLDLDIDNYVTFDFSAVANAIDILGGVEIDIASDLELKLLNKYINHTNGILDTNAKTIGSKGVHNLDGVQAVAYARIRYTGGGDFKRTQRQRLVFSEMVKKAKKASLKQLNSLINEIFPQIQTDLERNEIISMVTAMIKYDMGDSSGFPIDKRACNLGSKGSIVAPCDLESNVVKLHRAMYGEEDYKPSSTVKEYSSKIINDTGYTADDAVKDDFSEKDDFDGNEDSDSESGEGSE